MWPSFYRQNFDMMVGLADNWCSVSLSANGWNLRLEKDMILIRTIKMLIPEGKLFFFLKVNYVIKQNKYFHYNYLHSQRILKNNNNKKTIFSYSPLFWFLKCQWLGIYNVFKIYKPESKIYNYFPLEINEISCYWKLKYLDFFLCTSSVVYVSLTVKGHS